MKASTLESPMAAAYFKKFSNLILGQDDYWIAQSHTQALPKGIKALQKILNAKNCSFNILIAEAKRWNTPTFFYKPESCLKVLYQMFSDAEQGDFKQCDENLSLLTKAQQQYRQDVELKSKLDPIQMCLKQATTLQDNLKMMEAYKELGLLYWDTDKIRYSREALQNFSQAIALKANGVIAAFCLRKRAALYLTQGQSSEGINDLREACGWDLDNPQTWFEYGEALIGLGQYKEAILPLKKALVIRPEHDRTQILLKEAIAEGKLPTDALENIELLLAAGYTLETLNAHAIKRGELPLWLKAAQLGNGVVMEYLALQLDTQVQDTAGNTALHYAARFGHASLIAFLSKMIVLDTQNKHGATSVYIAAEYGQVEVILSLQSLGANVDIPDNEGLRPVYIAAFNGHASTLAILLEAGADATGLGRALEHAKRSTGLGFTEVVRLLETHFKQYSNGIKPKKSPVLEQLETKQIAEHDALVEKTPIQTLNQTHSEESKDRAEIKHRLEQLESTFNLLVANAPSTRRKSNPLNLMDKKDEQERLQYVLEELRTFFCEERDVGEKTDNYAIYNEYLKKMNNGAQLIYQANQNRHVLYVNGDPLDAKSAIAVLSKMLASLTDPKPLPYASPITAFTSELNKTTPAR